MPENNNAAADAENNVATNVANKQQKPRVMLIAYGEGGHAKQAERLVALLQANGAKNFVSFSDVQQQPSWSLIHVAASELRSKMSGKVNLRSSWQTLRALQRLQREVEITGFISTGPGLAILPALLLRLRGVNVVHVETWCRFYHKSLTGRVMYFLAHRFIVQNKELLALYRRAEYGGRL